MKLIITFTFCGDYLWKSNFMALEKPGKLGPTLWPACIVCELTAMVTCVVCDGVQIINECIRQKGHSTQKWGWWRWGTDSADVVVSRRIVGASASVIFPCTIKCRRWRAVMEEVDKGCSEFCVTVGTATRISGILIHSRLKVLAVNLAGHPVHFGCMLA